MEQFVLSSIQGKLYLSPHSSVYSKKLLIVATNDTYNSTLQNKHANALT